MPSRCKQLLGRFLADAHGGDIRRFREVHFEEADAENQDRSSFKVMITYERWLKSAGPERQRELAILRLTGLFDRPISPPLPLPPGPPRRFRHRKPNGNR